MANHSHPMPVLPAPRASSLRSGGDLPRARFLDELAVRGYVHVAHDDFAGALDPARAARLGEPVLVRSSAEGDQLEAFVRLRGELLCLLDVGYGWVDAEVAGPDRASVQRAIKRLRRRLARPEPESSSVAFSFWSRGERGGEVRHRDVEVPAWAELRTNYAAGTAAALERLMGLREPARGRLLVWHGAPGTGKTYALRALSRAWRDWCSPHYVLDPETLLGADPRYLLDVLTWQDAEARDRWRLLVLEDAGELVCTDVRGSAALAPLLNLTDGLLGQGTRTLVLITTNEPIGRLHPAVRRPGRCLSDLEFGALNTDEARAWLDRSGTAREVTHPLTVSELYALAGGGETGTYEPARRPAFGFARAMR